jgi:hypothetical protein
MEKKKTHTPFPFIVSDKKSGHLLFVFQRRAPFQLLILKIKGII